MARNSFAAGLFRALGMTAAFEGRSPNQVLVFHLFCLTSLLVQSFSLLILPQLSWEVVSSVSPYLTWACITVRLSGKDIVCQFRAGVFPMTRCSAFAKFSQEVSKTKCVATAVSYLVNPRD